MSRRLPALILAPLTWAFVTVLALSPQEVQAIPYGVAYSSPQLVSVVSRQMHANKYYDLPVQVNGAPTVEARSEGTGGTYTFIATFDQTINDARVVLGIKTNGGTLVGRTVKGNQVTVKLSGVTDKQVVEVLMYNVASIAMPRLGSGGFRVRIIKGDVNGDGAATTADDTVVLANKGLPLTLANASCDLNCDGVIDAKDDTLAKSLARVFHPFPLLNAQQDNARFLTQATFGPTSADMISVSKLGKPGWIIDQFKKNPKNLEALVKAGAKRYNKGNLNGISSYRGAAWWESVMEGEDPLRQRVAFALSEIFVVSDTDANVDQQTVGAANYYDMLAKDAFGNFRDIMNDVTMHPIMGLYLTYLYNVKTDLSTGVHPDENYARELMQLFTIGLYQLNDDGTHKLDANGQAIPTYGNAEITNFARVFTGISLGGPRISFWGQKQIYNAPMSLWNEYHDEGTKVLLSYPGSGRSTFPNPGITAAADIKNALNNIFNHPNVGPFISQQLIQKLVTSNPSTAYVGRITKVFNDNGHGVRGDMKSVIKAILLDDEARDPWLTYTDPEHGHLRNPVLRAAHIARSFNAHPLASTDDRRILRWTIWNLSQAIGMEPLRSPSVFNFYAPNYQPPGPVLDSGLVGPEFQIVNAASVVNGIVYFRNMADVTMDPGWSKVQLNVHPQELISGTPINLVNNIDLYLTGGTLSASTRASALNATFLIPAYDENQRARTALVIMANSPDYVVQK